MKNRKAVEPPTTYRFQTTWTSGTRDKASGKEALWDRFLSYGYDCHSLTTRVTFRSAVGEKGISAMNETKKKKTEKKERGREEEREREGEGANSQDTRCHSGIVVWLALPFFRTSPLSRKEPSLPQRLLSHCVVARDVEESLDVTAFVRVVASR